MASAPHVFVTPALTPGYFNVRRMDTEGVIHWIAAAVDIEEAADYAVESAGFDLPVWWDGALYLDPTRKRQDL